jgi:hypothetical protein
MTQNKGYRNGCRACLFTAVMAGLDTISTSRRGLLTTKGDLGFSTVDETGRYKWPGIIG